MMAWLIAAVSAPLSQVAGKDGWIAALTAGVVCGVLCLLTTLLPTQWMMHKKWYCILQMAWLVLVLSEMLRWSLAIWPTAGTTPVVPVTLLILAAMSAYNGASVSSRTASMLFWFVSALYVLVIFSGIQNVKLSYLKPEWRMPSISTVTALLLPTAVSFIPREREQKRLLVYPIIALFLTAAALFTVGTLSPAVAGSESWPLYESGKSLSLFGVAERFEAFISVASTMGYCALYCLILSGMGHLAQHACNRGKAGVIVGTVLSGALLFCPQMPSWVLPMGILLLWILLPGLGSLRFLRKSTKKGK